MQLSSGSSGNRSAIHINREVTVLEYWFHSMWVGPPSVRSKHATFHGMDRLAELFTSAVSCIDQISVVLLLRLKNEDEVFCHSYF